MMRRFVLTLLLLFGVLQLSVVNCQLSLLGASAQTAAMSLPVVKEIVNKPKPWQWGIEAGLDLSHFSASRQLISAENRTGWFVGLKLKTKIPLPNLGFDAALVYDQNKFEYQPELGTYREKKMHMFQVPVNLRYNWTIVSSFVLYLASGPQWNWVMDKAHVDEIGKLEHSFFDWNIGMGFDILRHVQFGFNYNIPLGKMGEVNQVNLEGHTWNVRLAYYF